MTRSENILHSGYALSSRIPVLQALIEKIAHCFLNRVIFRLGLSCGFRLVLSGRDGKRIAKKRGKRGVIEDPANGSSKEGLLRHPVFVGLREDKPATEIRREMPGV